MLDINQDVVASQAFSEQPIKTIDPVWVDDDACVVEKTLQIGMPKSSHLVGYQYNPEHVDCIARFENPSGKIPDLSHGNLLIDRSGLLRRWIVLVS
jgi:hypothetical protein